MQEGRIINNVNARIWPDGSVRGVTGHQVVVVRRAVLLSLTGPERAQAEPNQQYASQLSFVVQRDEAGLSVCDFHDPERYGVNTTTTALAFAVWGVTLAILAPAATAETVRNPCHRNDGLVIGGDGFTVNRAHAGAARNGLEHGFQLRRHRNPPCFMMTYAPSRCTVSMEKAGRQMAIYSAPSAPGVLYRTHSPLAAITA